MTYASNPRFREAVRERLEKTHHIIGRFYLPGREIRDRHTPPDGSDARSIGRSDALVDSKGKATVRDSHGYQYEVIGCCPIGATYIEALIWHKRDPYAPEREVARSACQDLAIIWKRAYGMDIMKVNDNCGNVELIHIRKSITELPGTVPEVVALVSMIDKRTARRPL